MNLIKKVQENNGKKKGLQKESRENRENKSYCEKLLIQYEMLDEENEILISQIEEIKDLVQMGYNEVTFLKKVSEKFNFIDLKDAVDTREYYFTRFSAIARRCL